MFPRCAHIPLLLGVSAWLGCSDSPAAPQILLGTYALYSVNGDALPAVLALGSCPTRVYAGTMTVDTASQLAIALDVDPLCDTDSTPQPRVLVSTSGLYSMGGGKLMLPSVFGGIPGTFLAEPVGDRMALRMGAALKDFWHDPLFMFGPRQPLTPSLRHRTPLD